ncbi:hypothetical protein SKAU_G00402800 [Synaphobranchus kaupii]|uniref:Uncharacterized protein n=1 Tax=Synaphobranchus kaupii TaxID=118154 RepID=A0A9Q1E9F0_SYNKA|nr:hypothetical protein SKAU_G00402800 [Synaphobranchus kaupii]
MPGAKARTRRHTEESGGFTIGSGTDGPQVATFGVRAACDPSRSVTGRGRMLRENDASPVRHGGEPEPLRTGSAGGMKRVPSNAVSPTSLDAPRRERARISTGSRFDRHFRPGAKLRGFCGGWPCPPYNDPNVASLQLKSRRAPPYRAQRNFFCTAKEEQKEKVKEEGGEIPSHSL